MLQHTAWSTNHVGFLKWSVEHPQGHITLYFWTEQAALAAARKLSLTTKILEVDAYIAGCSEPRPASNIRCNYPPPRMFSSS